MVIIRLSRGGAKKRPFYHIVATDSRSARDGRSIERLGYFNPIARGQEPRIYIDLERVAYWIANGAQPSERVASIIEQAKKMPKLEPMRPTYKPKAAPKPRAEVSAKAPEISTDKNKNRKGDKPGGKNAGGQKKPLKASDNKKPPVKKAATNAPKAAANAPKKDGKGKSAGGSSKSE